LRHEVKKENHPTILGQLGRKRKCRPGEGERSNVQFGLRKKGETVRTYHGGGGEKAEKLRKV